LRKRWEERIPAPAETKKPGEIIGREAGFEDQEPEEQQEEQEEAQQQQQQVVEEEVLQHEERPDPHMPKLVIEVEEDQKKKPKEDAQLAVCCANAPLVCVSLCLTRSQEPEKDASEANAKISPPKKVAVLSDALTSEFSLPLTV
jgi:hypothetical protein